MTGSSSRMAAFNRPLASYALDGIITLSPGQLAYQLSNAWECVEASCPAEAVGPRKTIGQGNCPPAVSYTHLTLPTIRTV